jgi:hypothetical protein
MTSMPEHDPLVSLWQTAPKPDTQHLVQDLQRLNRLHQRLDRTVLAIMCGVAILLIFEEATGRTGSRGLLSLGFIAVVVVGVLWKRRARCSRLDALTMGTISLLKAMIKRAKKDLFIARCLYAGVPLGATVGYLVSNFVGIGASSHWRAAHSHLDHSHLDMVQTVADVAVLIVMIVAGFILARSRSVQVRELNEKLRAIESDL